MRGPHVGFVSSDQGAPRDADLLQLVLDTTSSRNDDEAVARQEYMRIQSASSTGLPDYDEALVRGWFRTIWGRVTTATGLRDYYRRGDVPYAEELRGFVWWLDEVRYHITQSRGHASAGAFEDYISGGAASGQKPPIQTPSWIAARLWDYSPTVDLATWTMRWELLDWVLFVPSTVWSQQDAQRFREAALLVLLNANLPEWDHVSMTASLRAAGDIREDTPLEVPPDLLGRVLGRSPSHYGTDLFEPHALCALLRVLALELPHVEAGPVPSVIAQELVELALRHPDLCETLVDCCLQSPQVLADLILCPPAASLVCYLAATWHGQFQVDRDCRNEAADTVQSSLLADCLEVLRHHLVQDAVSPVEYARLLIVMQQHDCGGNDGLPLLPIGLEQLRGLPKEIKQRVRHALVQAANTKANSPEFAVMLKASAAISEPFTPAEADTVASAYQQAFNAKERADTRWVDAAGAAVLARLAMNHDGFKSRILCPLDLKAELAHRPDDIVGLGLVMREQIRMLSRAVVGYPESVPDELVAALAETIQSGACNRPDKCRVDAFTFQLDATARGRREPRLEADLIEAVNRLEAPAQQEQLVKALLTVEEPLVLALLLPRAPAVHREAIRARLKVLTPEEASQPAFITQVQERIQVLLDAGLPDIAKAYLQDGEGKLRGKNLPALAVETLNQQLQLHYMSGTFESIESATIPEDLPPEHKAQAQRTLDFFRALVCLKKVPPAANQAAAIFRRLYQEHPLPAYAINLLAARIAKLLGENLFRSLAGEEAAMARIAIEEADRAIPSAGALSDMSRAIHMPNCAAAYFAAS